MSTVKLKVTPSVIKLKNLRSSSGVVQRSNTESVSSGATTLSVSFNTAMSSTDYQVFCQWKNSSDTYPDYQPIVVTNKTINGFTASWNSPTPTANYEIDWLLAGTNNP